MADHALTAKLASAGLTAAHTDALRASKLNINWSGLLLILEKYANDGPAIVADWTSLSSTAFIAKWGAAIAADLLGLVMGA